MKLTLSVTASAATLAAILSLIDQEGLDVSVEAATVDDDDQIPFPLMGTTAAVPAPQLSGDGERDSTGLLWDERIHAATKVKTSDGKWRQKRGVDKALVAQVEAQLRSTLPPPAPQPVAAAPAVAPPPPMPPIQPVASASAVAPLPVPAPPLAPVEQPFTPPMPPATPQPMAPPVPAAPPAPVEQPVAAAPAITFHDVMMKCQNVTSDYLTSICQQLTAAFSVQVNSITDIASNQQMIDYAAGCFSRDGKW